MIKYRRGKMDFPWAYNSRCPHAETKFGGGAPGTYKTITDMEALELWAPWIGSLFAEDAVLFCWVTWPKMPFWMRFVEAMGFEYSSLGFDWVKIYKSGEFFRGPGFYTSSNSEPCLVLTRGSVPPVQKLVPQPYKTEYIEGQDFERCWCDACQEHVIIHRHVYDEAGKIVHSGKPDVFKERIDAMYPPEVYGMGLGLFERRPQGEGWHLFGDQIEDKEGNPVLSDIPGPNFKQMVLNLWN
jgi:N6-adenosine-specific RNA methylase IME4